MFCTLSWCLSCWFWTCIYLLEWFNEEQCACENVPNAYQKCFVIAISILFKTSFLYIFAALFYFFFFLFFVFIRVWKKAPVNLENIFFISRQRFFSLRISTFRNLDTEISWCHQIPEHKKRDTIYWLSWVKHSLLMKLGQFISYYKWQKFIKKPYKNWDLKTSSRPFLSSKRNKHNLYWKNEGSCLY